LVFHSSTIAMMHGPINIKNCIGFTEILQVMFHGLLGNKKEENYPESVQSQLQNCHKLWFLSVTGNPLLILTVQFLCWDARNR